MQYKYREQTASKSNKSQKNFKAFKIVDIQSLTSWKRYAKIRIQLRTYVLIVAIVGIYKVIESLPIILSPDVEVNIATA